MLKIIRLNTGDELLGEITNSRNPERIFNKDCTIMSLASEYTTIKNPLILGVLPKEEKIIFLDPLIYADHKELIVRTSDIVFIIEPKQGIKDKHTTFWSEKDTKK